jgi:hypothetical protein
VPDSPLSRLPQKQRQEFLRDLNYLNTGEIKKFCKRHAIPYTITIEEKDGRKRKTPEDDRKGIVLERVRHFLRTGTVLEETCFCASVVNFGPLPSGLTADDKLFYGQYEKGNRGLVALLKTLTNGHYRDGAIARILMRDFWSRGKAPTFREFAAAWLQASQEHTGPNPEWAFLSDRARGTAGNNWKRLRAKKATAVLQTLNRIVGAVL